MEHDVKPDNLNPIYKEMAEIIGVDNTYLLFKHFKGQQVSYNQRFYNNEYVSSYIKQNYDGRNVGDLSRKFQYSERRIYQLLKEKK